LKRQIDGPEVADRFETLRPITYFLPTPPPSGQNYKAKDRGDVYEDESSRDIKEFPDTDATKRQAIVLRVASILTGSMLGLMQQMNITEINIYPSVNAINSLFRAELDTMFGWARHPCFSASDFSRKHRTCITRGVVDHSMYQLLFAGRKNEKFDHIINDTVYALSVNALEPVETVCIFHNALRQTVDLGLFVLTHHMAKSMRVPILPFEWLQAVVARGGCTAGDSDSAYDLNSPECRQVRTFIQQVQDRNQLLRAASSSSSQSQWREPYVSSPANEDGNSVCNAEQRNMESSTEHIFRVNEVDVAGNVACIARNLTSSMYAFFKDTNVTSDIKNLIPMITRHSEKVLDFGALFNMKNVLDIGFFMRLFHDDVDFLRLDGCLKKTQSPNSNSVTTLGMFNSNSKPLDGKPAFTAYGIHLSALLVIAAMVGKNFSPGAMSAVHMATRITEHLLQDVPRSLLYPSGDRVQMKVMLENRKSLHLQVTQRDQVRAQFFFRRRNGEKIANRPMEQNVIDGEAQLSSPLRPFWFEDCIHILSWLPFLRLAYGKVLNPNLNPKPYY
jgi:hypothetical protein